MSAQQELVLDWRAVEESREAPLRNCAGVTMASSKKPHSVPLGYLVLVTIAAGRGNFQAGRLYAQTVVAC